MVHVVVIGAYGSAGIAAAEVLAESSAVERLTLVDDGEPGGGLCILRGCMPSKELLSAGAHRFQARHDDRLTDPPTIDQEAVVTTKDDHIQNFAAHRRAAVDRLATADHVTFEHATARFVDDRVIALEDREIPADYVVLATGSTVNVPEIPGIEAVAPKTSADVLDTTVFPDSAIVMGFGYIGLEIVPYLTEVGDVDLTVIEHDERPLDEADPAFGDGLLDIYRSAFDVEVLTNTYEQRLEETADGGVKLVVETDGAERTVRGDALYTFTGRRPNLNGLGMETTALQPEPGWVRDTMQAAADDRVFVVGDVNGREPILHVAKEEGALAGRNIENHVRNDSLERYDPLHHHVIFTGLGVYPFVRIGHSATSAAATDREIVTATRQVADDGVFRTKAVPHGLARLVAEANDGTVLGYQGLHYHADVMAKTLQVVIERGLTVEEVPDRAYHPTTPEVIDGLLRDVADQL